MPTVYIVNKSGHDFTPASDFGELRFMSEGTMHRFAVSEMYRVFAKELKDSKKEDYLLLTSLTTMSVIAAACFTYIHGRLNLLMYDTKKRRYVERRLVLGELLADVPAG